MLSSFAQHVASYILRHRLLRRSDAVLVAVSGGPDSMALLEVLRELTPTFGLTIHVAHVHHMLRPVEADADRSFVRRYAGFVDLPYASLRVNVPARRRAQKESVEHAARVLRYDALERLRARTGLRVIATGHHADDQIETVLMRTLRGTDIRGYAGILPARTDPPVIRPLLSTFRADIMAYLDERRVPYREDSSNEDTRYKRNDIRHRLIPQFRRHGELALLSALPAFADVSRRFGQFIEKKVQMTADEKERASASHHRIGLRTLLSLPEGLRRSYVAITLREFGVELSTDRILRVLNLLRLPAGKRLVFRSSGLHVIRDRDHLVFQRAMDSTVPEARLRVGGQVSLGSSVIRASRPVPKPGRFTDDRTVAWVDASKVGAGLRVRLWRSGDRIQPLGMQGRTKKVSDLLQDARVPLYYKEVIPVVTCRGTIVWVCGVRPDERFKITPDSRSAIRLTYHTTV